MVGSRGNTAVEAAAEAEAAVTDTSVPLYASAACVDMALGRATPGVGSPAAGTAGGRRASVLVDDGLEDKRTFLTDAGLLADQLHSPPSAEACAGAAAEWGRTG